MPDAIGGLRRCPIGCPEAGDALGELGTTGTAKFSRTHFTLVRCGCRKLLYLSPAPSTPDLRTLYVDQGQFGDHYTDESRVRAILAYINSALDRVVAHCQWASTRRIRALEVGAGLAWMCRAVKSRYPSAVTTAQDVSPEAVASCAWVDHYLQAEVTDSRLASYGPYDLISMTHVIEHLVDPVATVSRCRELLAPDGLIFVTAPHRPRGWQDAAPDLEKWTGYSYNHVPAHIQYFSEASLRRLATACNCALVYWSHDHEGGEAFEAWLAPSGATSVWRWLDRVRAAFHRRWSKHSFVNPTIYKHVARERLERLHAERSPRG